MGIGNPIPTDDGVGVKIAHKRKEDNPELEVAETSESGMALLELIAGYDKLFINTAGIGIIPEGVNISGGQHQTWR